MKNYTKIQNWKFDQFKNFALAKGFVLPEISPEELAKFKPKPTRTRRNGPVIVRKPDDNTSLNKRFTHPNFIDNFVKWVTKKNG